jgi:hypothetical protein
MSTFFVNPTALDGLSTVLYRRWLDLRAGSEYTAKNTWLDYDGGQFGLLLPHHRAVVKAVGVFNDAADRYAATIAGRVDAALTLYRTTDQRAADRLLPTWSPLVPPVDAPPPTAPKAGPEIFHDVVAPADQLITPGSHHEDMPYRPSWTDLLSPTSSLRDALYLASVVAARFGLMPHPIDPFEAILIPFVGDWPGLLRCAEVYDHLAAELDAVGVDLTHEEQVVPQAWTGNAADGLRYCLIRFTDGTAGGARSLRAIAAAYRELAGGAYRNSQLIGALLTIAADWHADIVGGELGALLEIPTQVMDYIQLWQQLLPIVEDTVALIRHGLRDDIIRRLGFFAVTALMPDMTEPFVTAPGAMRHRHPVAVAGTPGQPRLIMLSASARDFASVCRRPRTEEVIVRAPVFWMPRIAMHMCSQSSTTITPRASSFSASRSAICDVSRSCTCGRRL